jgi:hypothetical protein
VAQLHLAFSSPVTTIEGQDKRKFAHQFGKSNRLIIVIGQLEIGKPFADFQVHGHTSIGYAQVKRRLWITFGDFAQ